MPINTVRGVIFYNSRQNPQALANAKSALALDPDFPPAIGSIAKVYDIMGKDDEAMRYYKRYFERVGIDRRMIDGFGTAYEQAGMQGARRWFVDNFSAAAVGQLSLGYSLALQYAMLGEKDRAFEWLQRLSDSHCWNVANVKVEPMFESLRNDPRYEALLKKIGLEG